MNYRDIWEFRSGKCGVKDSDYFTWYIFKIFVRETNGFAVGTFLVGGEFSNCYRVSIGGGERKGG